MQTVHRDFVDRVHVLPDAVLLRVVHTSWTTVWATRVGRYSIRALRVDAQVIGKLFQEVMTHELHAADQRWRHPDAPRSFRDPDFVFGPDPEYNFELKMCGQAGGRAVYGNRCSSSGFASENGKSRSTWLLTINYSDDRINLIRFGRVSNTDWIGQRSATGNASRLCRTAYQETLRVIRGPYQRSADPRVLRRVGKGIRYATVGEAAEAGVAEAIRFLEADFYV